MLRSSINIVEVSSDEEEIPTKQTSNNSILLQHLTNNTNSQTFVNIEDKSEDYGHYISKNNNSQNERHNILSANFQEFIDLCYNTDDTDEMKNIVNKILLHNYLKADEAYIKSHAFNRLLQDVITNIKENKRMHYTSIVKIATNLKGNVKKRKVELITLGCDAHSDNNNYTVQDIKNNVVKEQVKDIVNVNKTVQSVNNDLPIIVLDIDESEMVVPKISNLENSQMIREEQVKEIAIDDESEIVVPKISNLKHSPKIREKLVKETDESEIIVPKDSNLENSESTREDERNLKIKDIEKQINNLKQLIEACEQEEVDFNSESASPYLKSDSYKRKLLAMYGELCKLTDCSMPLKRKCSRIRLTVKEGNVAGPAKRLEHWLNSIRPAGDTRFPDFNDVIKCVITANVEDCLGWDAARISVEARALFNQCGGELKKRRQRREWSDLVELYPAISADPADGDPELNARLLVNKAMADQKRIELLEYYSNKHEICTATKRVNKRIQDKQQTNNNTKKTKLNDQSTTSRNKQKLSSSDSEDNGVVSSDTDSEIEILDDICTNILENGVELDNGSIKVKTEYDADEAANASNANKNAILDILAEIENRRYEGLDVVTCIRDIEEPIVDITFDSSSDEL